MKKKRIIQLLVFIICVICGWAITELLRGGEDEKSEITSAISPSGNNNTPKTVAPKDTNGKDNGKKETIAPANPTEDINASEIVAPKEKGKSTLENEKENEKKEIALPKNPSTSQQTDTEPVEVKQPKLSPKQITDAINNNDRNAAKLKNVRFIYENLRTEVEEGEEPEEAQQSVANIRNYIRTGIWTSVTCTNVTYYDNGAVKSVTLRINR